MHRTNNIKQGLCITSLRILFFALFAVTVLWQPLYAAEQKTVALFAADSTKVEDVCGITKLPETGVFRQEQSRGMFVTAHYPDPRKLPADYTGCIQVWMEANGHSELFTVGRFEGGVVRAIRVPAMNIECTYEEGKLSAESAKRAGCPHTTAGMELGTWQK